MSYRNLILISVALVFSGCASIPDSGERPSLEGASESVIDGWSKVPPITEVDRNTDITVSSPERIPDSIRSQSIEIETPGFVSGKHLAYLFDKNGIQALIADTSLESSSIYLPSFDGTMGNLTDLISEATNLSFRWSGGAVIIDQKKNYIVKVEQNTDLADNVSEALKSLGASDVLASADSGTIYYSASTRQQKNIAEHLQRLSLNSALIQVQLAVINVNLNDTRKTGLDWNALDMKFGDIGKLTEEAIEVGTAGTVTGTGLGIQFASDDLTLSSVLNMLSTYGNSRTEQNLTLQTLSGLEVGINSGDEVPYISNVELKVDNENFNSVSGFETDVQETGFKAFVTPRYDHEESIVTIDVKLDLVTLKGFRELSAGQGLEKVSQPEIQKQELESLTKMKAGETVLLGGLIVDNYSDNRQSLSWLENLPFGSQSIKNNQNAIFVLIRPTVTVFGGGSK